MRIRRWSRPIALAALFLGSAAIATTAQAATISSAPHAAHSAAVTHVPMLRPSSHLHLTTHSHLKNIEYSGNWGGYADTGTTFTSVTSTWTQPSASCSSSQDTYSAFWVGLDGYSSNSVEQTGTEVDCVSGSPQYYTWYEMYPAYPVYYSNPIRAGDSFTGTVSYSGGTYTLTLTNHTEGWTKTTRQSGSYSRASAEIIVEAPYSGGVLPLAHFGTTTFGSDAVNGRAVNASGFTVHQIDIEENSTVDETTSSLSGGTSFTVTWHAST